MVSDFGITDETEKKAVFGSKIKHQELLEYIDGIVQNRQTADISKRVPQEYYLRSRIVCMFPSAYSRYISIRRKENEEMVFPISEKMQEFLDKRKEKSRKYKEDMLYQVAKKMF